MSPGVESLAAYLVDHGMRVRVVDGELWADLVAGDAAGTVTHTWERIEPTYAAVRAWLGY